jgi:O-antigen ligase
MARAVLIVAFAAVPHVFLVPKLAELLHVPISRFLDLIIYLPAVAFGVRSWLRTRSFARSWTLLLCVAVVWIGLLHALDAGSQRGLLIAFYLTMILPVAALIDEQRCWWVCARVFVISSVVALGFLTWSEYQATNGRLFACLVRFGSLISMDGSTRLANPNPVGGQLAFAAILAFVLYLKSQSQRMFAPSAFSSGTSAEPDFMARNPTAPDQTHQMVHCQGDRFGGYYLAATVVLSLGCFLTASRGAFFSWFAGMAVLVLFGTQHLSQNKLRDVVAFSGMLLAVALLAVTAGSFTPWGHLYERTVGHQDQSFASLGSRTEIWKHAVEAWWSDPKFRLFGTGTGTADLVLGDYDDRADYDEYGALRRNSHSAYIEWGLSLGALGIVAAMILASVMVFKARQLDLRQNMASRQAILVYIALFSGTIVTYRHSWWFAAGSLILAMLTDPDAASNATSNRRQTELCPPAELDKDPIRRTHQGHSGHPGQPSLQQHEQCRTETPGNSPAEPSTGVPG